MKTLALLLLSLMPIRLEYRLKRIAGGLTLLTIGIATGMIAMIAALFALFFALADISTFVSPSLFTALFAFLIAALISYEGKRLISR
jgi:hypothetical protein